MYRSIQTPNSPLSPLPPLPSWSSREREQIRKSDIAPNQPFLTPSYPTKIASKQNKRRSFTPSVFDNISPPAISPINTVFESPVSPDSDEFVIKKRPAPNTANITNKSPPFAVSHIYRAYHSQRKNENRPIINYDLMSLRRALHESFANLSGEKAANNSHNFEWNNSPMQFSPYKAIRQKVQVKAKPATPSIVLRTPSLEIFDSPESDGLDDTTSAHNSILDHSWNVVNVLKDIGLDKYIEKFEKEEVDLLVFCNLSPEDLFTLNIDREDHEVMLRAVAAMKPNYVEDEDL